MAGGGIPTDALQITGGYLSGKKLIFPLSLVISLFFLWGFSYGLLDVLNKHFQTVLGVTRLESTGLQVMYFGGGYLCFSPIAAEVLKRKGYKITIMMGLTLYSLGAIFFLAGRPLLLAHERKGCLSWFPCLHFCNCVRPGHSGNVCQLLCRRHRSSGYCLCSSPILPELEWCGVVYWTSDRIEGLL